MPSASRVLFAIGFALSLSALAVAWHLRNPAASPYQLQRTWSMPTELASRLATAVFILHISVTLSLLSAVSATLLRGADSRSPCRPPVAWDHRGVSSASGMGPPFRQ